MAEECVECRDAWYNDSNARFRVGPYDIPSLARASEGLHQAHYFQGNYDERETENEPNSKFLHKSSLESWEHDKWESHN